MRLQSIALVNYRNLCDFSFEFPADSIGFIGDNGQGKTNFLEAIYFLASGDSWRGSEDADVLKFNSEFARIDGTFISDSSVNLSIVLESTETHHLKKKYLINDISRKKETYTSQVAVVLFHPEDIHIVTGSPSSRRSLLDSCIAEAFPYYRRLISQYGRVLSSRNRLLDAIREGSAQPNQLDYWTESMIKLGSEIYLYRYRFFSFICRYLDSFSVTYLPLIHLESDPGAPSFLQEITEVYAQRVAVNLHKEIMSATSHYGPHKDDYLFLLGDRDIGRFGSRGEQRAVLFAFKKAHVFYIESVRKHKPLLLLDDVFSEFDQRHRDALADLCEGYQTFVTGTEEQFFRAEKFDFGQLFHVSAGNLSTLTI